MAPRPTQEGAASNRKTPTKPAIPSRAAGRSLEGMTEQMEALAANLDALTRRFDEFSRQVLDELRALRDARGAEGGAKDGGGGGGRRGRAGREVDPGDAVPPGVAPLTPAPLTDEDRKVLDKLQHDFPPNT